jgi:hypothetical protein
VNRWKEPVAPRYGAAAFHAALVACGAAAYLVLSCVRGPARDQPLGLVVGALLCAASVVWNLVCLQDALDPVD